MLRVVVLRVLFFVDMRLPRIHSVAGFVDGSGSCFYVKLMGSIVMTLAS